MYQYERRPGCSGVQLVVAVVIALGSLVAYYSKSSVNPVTGEKQHIDISVDQEIALGLQAAPEMESEFGGEDPDPQARQLVADVGGEIVSQSKAGTSPYRFQFHALADEQTLNAFALPGGQVFITHALLTKLNSRGQLAGVLAHECGHVINRHSAEQLAKAQLTQGLSGAAALAAYSQGSRSGAAVSMLVGQLVSLKFSRNDELEADRWGVILMSQAGYDPRAMLDVMEVLKRASGGGRTPEFFATHPNPDNREQRIQEAIHELFPNGLPSDLKR